MIRIPDIEKFGRRSFGVSLKKSEPQSALEAARIAKAR
jgi:hypothetical protein